jgi:hypothetical protein
MIHISYKTIILIFNLYNNLNLLESALILLFAFILV